jgi:hypothetical protein
MAACGVVCLQVCGALSRRVRRPIVQLEYPLVAGTDAENVEEVKTQLLQLLKGSLGLTEKADEAPVRDPHISSIKKEVHPLAHRESSHFCVVLRCPGGDAVCHVSCRGGGRAGRCEAHHQRQCHPPTALCHLRCWSR